ncbi:uncharacterized protein BCR38DRAFT_335879 [Pseudomassariella vexata]|uniref:Mitochondrial ATPase expression-domain-containing protein n=1 Tax=Pseudomassariella vexata TaxID=1141098 RepID=A0A1Y2ECH8_9PEZI|nr:uncharacterized protein BCR38DRAFT_335879 [Pseudomassariella vexata]ORY68535.1 hypothetical protein BCR38DRAFT_335879 [Pseudomassariella vexata]
MEELIEAVAVLPRTTFSEFLRALDPTNTGPDNDPTHGAQIQVGMWKRLNMEHAIDDWGTRKLYIRLLQRMLRLMVALQKSGQQLNINDYMPLIRAAGATSDMEGAKLLWKQMQWTGTNHWRQSDAYNEFIKARFLVEPLYYGFDKTRTMVQPRNLHRMGHVKFPWYTIKKLDRLRFNTRLLGHRFGLNKTVSHAQDVSRALRKRKPITRVFQHILLHGHDINEKLLCSAMIAFGRAGSLRFIRTRILEDWFNISVYKHKTTGVVQVGPATRKTMALKDFTRPVRPRIRPTEQLLHAMVQTYCGNGQLAMAFQLLDYVSKAYNIPITPKIWFELLEWTYVMSVPPISSAWMIAGLRDRVPDKSATEMIWNTMTAAYNVKPGFDQYHFLISSLNHRGQYSSMIEHMRAARRFYDDKCAEHEAAILEYIRALRDGLHGIALTTVFRAYQRTRFEKQHMRYRMSLWCRRFLQKKFRTLNLNDEFAVRHIPDFVREFREFVENPVLYRTATGYVQLLDPVHEFEHRVYVRSLDLDIPMRGRGGREGKWHLKRVRRRHFAILSSHSLADRKTHKLNPLSLLLGELDSFRTPQLPEYRGKKELKANEIPLRMPRTNKGAREVSPTAPNFKPRRTRQ